jgi:hypothetical protein
MNKDNIANARHHLREFINLLDTMTIEEKQELRHVVADMSTKSLDAQVVCNSIVIALTPFDFPTKPIKY